MTAFIIKNANILMLGEEDESEDQGDLTSCYLRYTAEKLARLTMGGDDQS